MKKTKSLKRILAGALAALMSISTVPLAFAAGETTSPVQQTPGNEVNETWIGKSVAGKLDNQNFVFVQTEATQEFQFQFTFSARKADSTNYCWIFGASDRNISGKPNKQTLTSTIGTSSTLTWSPDIGAGLGTSWTSWTGTVNFTSTGAGVYNTSLNIYFDDRSWQGDNWGKPLVVNYEFPITVTVLDKQNLNTAIDNANTIAANSDLYTEATWADVQAALANAQSVSGNAVTDQTTIDRYTNALNTAVANLIYRGADYTGLNTAKKNAEAILNSGNPDANYPADTLATLREKYAAAAAIEGDLDIRQQSVIDNAAKALAEAVAAMVPFANYSVVEAALAAYSKLNPAYYNAEEFAKVTALADAARDSLNDKLPADQQEAVDQMAENLLDAIAALEMLDADTAKLTAWITDAMELLSSPEADTYTGASLNALMVAIINGKKVLDANLKIDQQATVDDAAQAIATAYQNLEKLPADKELLGEKLAEAKAYPSRSDYEDYNVEARTALEAAIASAQSVYDDTGLNIDDQATINAAVVTLMEAIRNIEGNWKPADYAKLDAAINVRKDEVAKAKEAVTAEGAKLYTDASISRVEAVIKLAESLPRDLNIKEQSKVDDMIVTLNSVLLEKNPADYTALNRLIEEKQDLLNNAGDEYTDESKSALQAALTAARAVVAAQYKIDEQGKVDAAVEALDAFELVLKDADFSALEAAIDAAEKFLTDPETDKLYKPEAIQTVRDALDQAKEVLGSDLTILEQEQVTQAADALNNAIAEAKGDYNLADVTALEAAVDAANAKLNAEDIADYTDTSVNALKEAVAKAQALIAENPNITRQDEVDAMADALNGMALVLKSADKSALEAAITAAEDLLATPDQYTDEFIEELKEVLEDAYAMLENADLTIKDQEQVDSMVADLTGKIEQPGYKDAVLTALNEAIAAAQAKIDAPNYQDYTAESRAALEAALEEAIALRDTTPDITQQAAVNEAAEKLNGIQLVLKGADYDALKAAIAEIEALLKDADLSDRFTNASIEVLDAALKEAQAVLEAGYDASQQDIVDDAVDALEAARDGLVPYNKIEQGDIRIVGGDERVDDMIYHKTPWYQTYKSQTATLRLEGLEEGWKVVKWEAANWSVDEPEATFTVNDDGTVSVSPNGKGIGARSFWIKVTVEDANGNKAEDIVKVRFYNWNWQK